MPVFSDGPLPNPVDGPLPDHPNAVTPQWLTGCLYASGALLSGAVQSIAVEVLENWNMAQAAHVRVKYDDAVSGCTPSRLFLKIATTPDPFSELVGGELAFYRRDLPDDLPLPKVYGAFHEESTGVRCLILEDLSHTHSQTPWPLPPTQPLCRMAFAAIARLHAHGWQQDISGTDVQQELVRRSQSLGRHLEDIFPPFVDYLDDRLSRDRRKVFERVFKCLPELMAVRARRGEPITCVHGDPHAWNILFPKDPVAHDCVFIDWEDWHRGTAAFDLAYMMALHWFPERRIRFEEHMLRHYLDSLNAGISAPYEWDDLVLDYRLGHLHNFVVPVFQLAMGIGPGAWWEHIERLFLSFDDLECADLLT